MTASYRGKEISTLSDAELALAATDVANCLTRATAAPSSPIYANYKSSLEAQSAAISAEQQKRAG